MANTAIVGPTAAFTIANLTFNKADVSLTHDTGLAQLTNFVDAGYQNYRHTIRMITGNCTGYVLNTAGAKIAGAGGGATLAGTNMTVQGWNFSMNIPLVDVTGSDAATGAAWGQWYLCEPTSVDCDWEVALLGNTEGSPFPAAIVTGTDVTLANMVLLADTGCSINLPSAQVGTITYVRNLYGKLVIGVSGKADGQWTTIWASNAIWPTAAMATTFDRSQFKGTVSFQYDNVGGNKIITGPACYSRISLSRSTQRGVGMTVSADFVSNGAWTIP
jgi:hypothetical protein